MVFGYARVSTVDQNPDLQLQALRDAGCERIFTDRATGSKDDRPELLRALETARSGDTLMVWALDRLGRNLQHLLSLAGELEHREIDLRSLKEGIDTSTAAGRLAFQIFGAMAEFERSRNAERTRAASAVARRAGTPWGRPSPFHDPKIAQVARSLLREGSMSKAAVARHIGCHPTTLYRWFKGGDPEAFVGHRRSEAA